MLSLGAQAMRCRHKLIVCCIGLLLLVDVAWALDPVTGDFVAINASQSKDLVTWRYADNPDIYIFDFPNLTQQGRSFNRVTHLTEQQLNEPYPRVFNNDELAKHVEAARRTTADFAFGHDVLAYEFVQFFNLAERDKIQLNPEELLIRDFMVAQGLIRNWRGIYQALRPNAVILSIPQAQEKRAGEPQVTNLARYAILLHEMAHGEFYANSYYANYCRRFWSETLNDEQREAFKKFLAKYNYSTVVDELLINEMQAYLMFTPDQSSFSATKLGVSDAELEAMRESFRKSKPPTKLPLRG